MNAFLKEWKSQPETESRRVDVDGGKSRVGMYT